MSELKVDTISPALASKIVVTPGVVVQDSVGTEQFEVTSSGEIKVLGPLRVGSAVNNTTGTNKQIMMSQGPQLPPVWIDNTYQNFPNVASFFPFGGIILWSGTPNNVPAGWALCDGRMVNGYLTPNLTDRFVVGVGIGGAYLPNDKGGTASVSLSVTQMADHYHGIGFFNNPGNNDMRIGQRNIPWNDVSNGTSYNLANLDGDNVIPYTSGETRNAAGVNASGMQVRTWGLSTLGSLKNGDPHENRPPYYALCYIMRVSNG